MITEQQVQKLNILSNFCTLENLADAVRHTKILEKDFDRVIEPLYQLYEKQRLIGIQNVGYYISIMDSTHSSIKLYQARTRRLYREEKKAQLVLLLHTVEKNVLLPKELKNLIIPKNVMTKPAKIKLEDFDSIANMKVAKERVCNLIATNELIPTEKCIKQIENWYIQELTRTSQMVDFLKQELEIQDTPLMAMCFILKKHIDSNQNLQHNSYISKAITEIQESTANLLGEKRYSKRDLKKLIAALKQFVSYT